MGDVLENHLDGCALDFTKDETQAADLEELLIPEGEEVDEDHD